MELYQCTNCGHGGWSKYELEQGLCPGCQEEDIDLYDEHDEGELLGYVCSGCGNIQNTNNGFGCNRCMGHSLDPWYG
jgi:DNA-directed RNA polymerase subunit RPC12/RpoP